MHLPGLDKILDDVKDMQGDLNTRLDRLAELLEEILVVLREK
jgi:hypothetical protein